jgi:UDP-N-acetyl-D-mannosaminuronic acid dehydrogenase
VASEFFREITDEIVVMSFEEAEFGKLMANTWRYAKFAIANDLARAAHSLNLDFEEIRRKISYKYPRAADIPSSGFAAGPCLPKDTQQLLSSSDYELTTLRAALYSNETMPRFVRRLVQNMASKEKTIGILGMAFKPRSDDIRESLSYRLRHELEVHFKKVLTTDPYVRLEEDPTLKSLEEVIRDSDVLVIGCPHPEYATLATKVPIVDIWGTNGWSTSAS